MPAWNPAPHAVFSQRWADPDDAQPTSVLLQHSLAPYVESVTDAKFETLQGVAYGYLRRALSLTSIAPRLELPPDWLEALSPNVSDRSFGWTPIEWPRQSPSTLIHEPYGSFRFGPANGDHLVALFAAQRLGIDQFIGSGFGLRIIVRLRRESAGSFEASITGLWASLPFGAYVTQPLRALVAAESDLQSLLNGLLTESKPDIEAASGLGRAQVRVQGLRLAGLPGQRESLVERRGVVQPVDADDRPIGVPYAFATRGSRRQAGTLLNLTPMLADAGDGHACVFVRDAASQAAIAPRHRAPRRHDSVLKNYRSTEQITPSLDAPLALGDKLRVLPCPRFVPGDVPSAHDPARSIHLTGQGPDIRSHDAAAVQGFRHARELLQRMQAYGLPPEDYFRVMRPEIDVLYRSGISPGPGKDGQTVNARVQPDGWPADFVGGKDSIERPAIRLHLAQAELARRDRKRWQPGHGPAPATAMGIGADSCWMWHEFGHVLLVAATGELELRFAHSPGDAMAAIVADPESCLQDVRPRWRFATFPWVFLPRRHDRSVLQGWGWNGAIHHALSQVPDSGHPRRKGYGSEQILSSTLFRLYRCLGGDTCLSGQPDVPERRRASHYTLCLLMEALQLLGDARIAPASHPEALAAALAFADTDRTDAWDVVFPPGSGTHYRRTRGSAHKAVRWAFEAQGLYMRPGASPTAPGAPPPVDVYIASLRPDADDTEYGVVPYGRGNYMPVSLHWQTTGAGPLPLWQAGAQAIEVQGDASVLVRVGNRGQLAAQAVSVELWWIEWPAGTAPPPWVRGAPWTAATTTGPAQQDVAAHPTDTVTFGPFVYNAPAQRHLLLAIATCADDRANIDTATKLACSLQATPVVDLVANDNNLGLRVLV